MELISLLYIFYLFSISVLFAVIPDIQPFCSSEAHAIAPTSNNSSSLTSPNNTGYAGTKSGSNIENDSLNSSYATYNNWANGYNNYQYASCAPTQPQYPLAAPPTAAAPPVVLYPHVYSTVNQNQIHLHLHGTDKLEQYLSSAENGLTISSARGGIEIGISTSDNPNVIMGRDDCEQQQQQQQHHHHQTHAASVTELDDSGNTVVDQEVGDPNSFWRPI